LLIALPPRHPQDTEKAIKEGPDILPGLPYRCIILLHAHRSNRYQDRVSWQAGVHEPPVYVRELFRVADAGPSMDEVFRVVKWLTASVTVLWHVVQPTPCVFT
jgi:hypothetical protein